MRKNQETRKKNTEKQKRHTSDTPEKHMRNT